MQLPKNGLAVPGQSPKLTYMSPQEQFSFVWLYGQDLTIKQLIVGYDN